MIHKLGLCKKPSGWWVTKLPIYYADGKPYTECGPYATKIEAQETKQGLEITLERANWDDEEPPKQVKTGTRKELLPQTSFDELVKAANVKAKSKVVSANDSKQVKTKTPVVKRKAQESEGFW